MSTFTGRELDLLERLKLGGTLKDAAEEVGIGYETAKTVMFRLNRKFRLWRRNVNKLEALRRDWPTLRPWLPYTTRKRRKRPRATIP